MLSRYTIYRRRPIGAGPLPEGIRQDTRFRTKHILRPTQEIVERFLADSSEVGWDRFRDDYLAVLKSRWQADVLPFEDLAALAATNTVLLGCNCPTKKNPYVRHCHTWLALQFMQQNFPALPVKYPGTPAE